MTKKPLQGKCLQRLSVRMRSRHGQFPAVVINGQRRAGCDLVGDDLPADQRLHTVLHEAAQRPGAVDRIVGAVDDILLGRVGQLDRELLVGDAAVEICHQEIDDAGDVLLCQRLVENDLIQAVQELRPERTLQQLAELTAGYSAN